MRWACRWRAFDLVTGDTDADRRRRQDLGLAPDLRVWQRRAAAGRDLRSACCAWPMRGPCVTLRAERGTQTGDDASRARSA
jgi:hypothetical protein